MTLRHLTEKGRKTLRQAISWVGLPPDIQSRSQLAISFALAGLVALFYGWVPAVIFWLLLFSAHNAGRDACKRTISRAEAERLEERGVSKVDIKWLESLGEIDERLAGRIIADNAIRRIAAGEATDYGN
jgi:hypothetical protein